MNRSRGPGRRPDAVARTFPPVAGFVATVILGCAEVVQPGARARGPWTDRTARDVAPTPAAETPPRARPVDAPVPAPAPETLPAPAPDPALVSVPAFEAPPPLLVRIAQAAPGEGVAFTVSGSYRLARGLHLAAPGDDDERIMARGPRLSHAVVRGGATGLVVNGNVLVARTATLFPLDGADVVVRDVAYRGALQLESGADGSITATNVVDLESYLKGVLLVEMPGAFPDEALRAQAITSRTYALYHALLGHVLRADQGSQVYGGRNAETAAARNLVDATRGEVLVARGATGGAEGLFQAFFHSTCGGATSSAADVFRIPAPGPLRGGVACTGCVDAPRFAWSASLAPERFDRIVPGATRFEVTRRDADGRALDVRLIDAAGRPLADLVADRFRNQVNAGATRLSEQLLSTWFDEITAVESGAFVVRGRGFGHGVGLCQYGARGLARAGVAHRRILEHYFPGSAVRRLYE